MKMTMRSAAFAAVFLCVGANQVIANVGAGAALEFLSTQDKPKGSTPPSRSKTAEKSQLPASNRGFTRVDSGSRGAVAKQIPSVSTGCLKPSLLGIIRNASNHFGSSAVITSGYRPSRRSYHGKCMAADVQIAGVSPGALAKYFRAQPGVGGVGTYSHTRSVHVDIAPRKFTWSHGRRRAG